MSLGKIALGVAAVVIIGAIVVLITGNASEILTAMWDWVFDALGAQNPPASPFK